MDRIKLFNAADALLRGYGWWMVYGREPRLRNLAAAMAVLASVDSGISIDPFDALHRRRGSGAIRNFAAIWIRDWMDGCVVSVSGRRRRRR